MTVLDGVPANELADRIVFLVFVVPDDVISAVERAALDRITECFERGCRHPRKYMAAGEGCRCYSTAIAT